MRKVKSQIAQWKKKMQHVEDAEQKLPDHKLKVMEHMTDPKVVQGLLDKLEQQIVAAPQDTKLLIRKADLLRMLGALDEAHALYTKCGNDAPPVKFVWIKNVLSEDEQSKIWDAVANPDVSLKDAEVGDYEGNGKIDPNTRSAKISKASKLIKGWFLERVSQQIKQQNVLAKLDMAEFTTEKTELQVTVHQNDGHFHVHKDAGGADKTRNLTYVYYFFKEPKVFKGGDLLIYDDSKDLFGYTRLIPKNNCMIFFASDRLHAVTRVSSQSEDILEGRWTVNGWLHKASEDAPPAPEAEPQAETAS